MLWLAAARNDLARRSAGSVCVGLALVAREETVMRGVKIQIFARVSRAVALFSI